MPILAMTSYLFYCALIFFVKPTPWGHNNLSSATNAAQGLEKQGAKSNVNLIFWIHMKLCCTYIFMLSLLHVYWDIHSVDCCKTWVSLFRFLWNIDKCVHSRRYLRSQHWRTGDKCFSRLSSSHTFESGYFFSFRAFSWAWKRPKL